MSDAVAESVDAAPSVATAPPVRDAASCDVCGHPTAGHDTIAARFCEATQQNALSRGCICAVK